MDRFARYYAWFLLVAAALPGILRLAMARIVATVTLDGYDKHPRRRVRYRRLGVGSALASLAMLPVYFFFRQQGWLLMTAILGILSGVEMVTNTSAESADSLITQNFLYGTLYLATSAAVYLVLLRR